MRNSAAKAFMAPWRFDEAMKAPVVTLPCGHPGVIWWPVRSDGHAGRIGCQTCHSDFESVTLENWSVLE